MTPLFETIIDALAQLDEHEIVPTSLELSRATYERLRSECGYPCTDIAPNYFMGVKIIVKDDM